MHSDGPPTMAALAPLTLAAHKLGLERIAARADDADVNAAAAAAWSSEDLREGLAAFKARGRRRSAAC